MRESLGSFRNLHQYPLVPTSMDSRCQMNMYADMTSISRPSSNSFFTQEAMRVGMIRNDLWRNDYVRDAPTVRIHYQFELDREQMWERIIAEESFRKQELEAEVRRQISMERELALQRPAGFPLIAPSSASLGHYPCNCNRRSDENSSSFGSVEYGALNRMPFQRHPDALMPEIKSSPQVGTGQLLVLPNPMNPTLSKTKREAIVSETAGASELPVVGMKKKKKTQEWSCALCHVSATCEQGLKDHLQGKKHKKAAFDLKVRNTSKQGEKSKGKEWGKRRGKKKRTSRARVEKSGA